jgi:hypothetical protein
MRMNRKRLPVFIAWVALCLATVAVAAQADAPVILAGAQLARVVPPGFYYAGQSAPTQMRNAAAARFGANRYVVAGLVDTSGYSADVRAAYEGFLITDSPVRVQDSELSVGAYGFGFTDDGKLNIYDLGGHTVLTVATERDTHLRRPRPLSMQKAAADVRLYSGRNYVVIAVK